jgi:hypothetical protein
MKTFLCALLVVLLLAVPGRAQIPRTISYQGILCELSGNPKPDNSYNLTFRLYDVGTGGSALWTETQSVQTKRGLFFALLGSSVSFGSAMKFDKPYWLSIQVASESEMPTRIPLTSAGYSFNSLTADSSKFAAAIKDGAVTNTKMSDGAVTSGKIASGQVVKSLNGLKDEVTLSAGSNVTITPSGNTLSISASPGSGGTISEVQAGAGLTGGGTSGTVTLAVADNGITNTHISTTAAIAPAKISGTAWTAANDGSGSGLDADLLDTKHAIEFASSGHDHMGQIWSGWTGSSDGFWLKGNVNWPWGMLLVDCNGTGEAVWGYNNGGGCAVRGDAEGSSSIGVYGGSDLYAAVVGRSGSGNGVEGYGYYGVYGEGTQTGVIAKGTNGYGLWASSTVGGSVAAVVGYNSGSNGNGVIGEANNGTSAYGVWGKSTNGYAGYFDGKVRVSGYLEKAGGGFIIDHPLDPANKYLYHSFVESPEMTNLYSGTVTLDGGGEAVVTLPDWFGALNKDFHYQLTCIGRYAPVFISEEISGNHFRIGGGTPGLKVSWQVTGVRQDAYAVAHPMPVEVEKAGTERGKYLHPRELGLPDKMSVEADKTMKPEEMQIKTSKADLRKKER